MGKQLIIVSLGILFAACAAEKPQEPREPIVVEQIGFEVTESPFQRNAEPLPDQQNIYVVWHYMDGSSKRVLTYRGWDFNKDGRIDMLEVLSLDGTPEAMAFDFDGDGKIDMLKKREQNEFDISQAVNMPMAPDTSTLAH